MNKSHLLMGAAAFAVAMSVSQPVLAQNTTDCVDANENGVCDSDENKDRAVVGRPLARSAVTRAVKVVPGGVWVRAFDSGLQRPWCRRCGSPCTTAGSSGRSSRHTWPPPAARASLTASTTSGDRSVGVGESGRPASSLTSTHQLARMSGAAVVLFSHRRRADGGYDLSIGPALDDFPSADATADTARVIAGIGAMVRAAPAQYLWIHRRFKRRPDGSDVYAG